MSFQELNSFNAEVKKQEQRIAKLKNHGSARDIDRLESFLSFVKSNPTTTYYPIYKIKSASNITTLDGVLSLVEFFSSLLEVNYCYFTLDDDEFIRISKESYISAVTEQVIPIDLFTGKEIKNYNPNNLSFFCTLSMYQYGASSV
ncbi:hypothetical protein [Pseudoalteromonas sp. RB2-MNA-CIBAN-0110]|jgi:hypothetical protein|uniref:hypothetical protein n=1 Tax=Pseudoalteromonas sp. RB2-MNA-CIBAN-0110 TaxID=3140439 RepID=UPI0033215037